MSFKNIPCWWGPNVAEKADPQFGGNNRNPCVLTWTSGQPEASDQRLSVLMKEWIETGHRDKKGITHLNT